MGQELPGCSFPPDWLGIYCPTYVPMASLHCLQPRVAQEEEEEEELLEVGGAVQYLGSCNSTGSCFARKVCTLPGSGGNTVWASHVPTQSAAEVAVG